MLFYVNPPGQHDQHIVGGDHDKSSIAQHNDVGAYVGSLVGSMAETDEAREISPVRKSDMLLAVSIASTEIGEGIMDVLRDAGASCIERAHKL